MKPFRLMAIFVAIYLLLRMLEDLLGLRLPVGFQVSMLWRLQRGLVPCVAAVLLLLNPKSLKKSGERFFYVATLFAVSLWYSVQALQSFFLVFTLLPWRVYAGVILNWLVVAVLWGTFWIATDHFFVAKKR